MGTYYSFSVEKIDEQHYRVTVKKCFRKKLSML